MILLNTYDSASYALIWIKYGDMEYCMKNTDSNRRATPCPLAESRVGEPLWYSWLHTGIEAGGIVIKQRPNQ
ncbi:hypothetical protein pVco7_gp031 [Vibrio phage pVco-7]|uniref:Uncharacterized protein n=1 Tax=Vibrio phage pVco-5 TaxID=1965485 RepID=A0A1W6JUT7_9CAUD|nr:hypothetical protein KNT61_gp032 [Vibrio phage pVco-5]ARM71020.1 hypothetical protein pVco5_032 [Vibrio phage pVco-5]